MCAACTAQAVARVQSRVGHALLRVPLADNSLRAHCHQLVVTQGPWLVVGPYYGRGNPDPLQFGRCC
jgi:hypothetical protein